MPNAMKEVRKTTVGLILNQLIQFVYHLRIIPLTLVIILRFIKLCCFAGSGKLIWWFRAKQATTVRRLPVPSIFLKERL
jgi:hypothetical protein